MNNSSNVNLRNEFSINAELIAWIHSQLEIARNRTYPYSAEYLLLQKAEPFSKFTKDNKDNNKLVKVQVTNFSATDNNTHIYICLKPSDSFTYQKIQPIPPVANIVSLCDLIIADIQLYGVDHCIQRLKDSGYKISE